LVSAKAVRPPQLAASFVPALEPLTLGAKNFSARGQERFSAFGVMPLGGAIAARSAVRGKQLKFQSESVMADVCLGVTVAGLYTLVGMGLTIVFM
jgi:hypothetical protein